MLFTVSEFLERRYTNSSHQSLTWEWGRDTQLGWLGVKGEGEIVVPPDFAISNGGSMELNEAGIKIGN